VDSTYVVVTRGNDTDEVVIRTLVGTYKESGSNHGRKVFHKTPEKPDPLFVEVFLYYWDGRDGPAYEGWWFGNKLGGTQVWAHSKDSGLSPPQSGWKIPWDGAVRSTLSVSSHLALQQQKAAEEVKDLANEIAITEQNARNTLQQARNHAGDYTNKDGLLLAEQTLAPQVHALTEAQKRLGEAQHFGSGQTANIIRQLVTQLQRVQGAVTTDLANFRATQTKLDLDEKNRQLDEKDTVKFNELMPEVREKTHMAEDQAEKTCITAEMITSAADDFDEVQDAVEKTEAAAKIAQYSISDARVCINSKMVDIRKFESERVQAHAEAELNKLQSQLQEAQNKLNPLKNVRQDFLSRIAAQKLVAEILESLSPAEVEVDRAHEATMLLKSEILTPELLHGAERALQAGRDAIMACMTTVEAKQKNISGIVHDELAKLQERGKRSLDRLTELGESHREAHERVLCESIIKEVGAKFQNVQDEIAKATTAEGPFLAGIEEVPLEESLAAVKACEAATTTASTAVCVAKMFVATKLVQVKRFSPGPSEDGQTRLAEFQNQLGAAGSRLTTLRAKTVDRRRSAILREAETQVVAAEALAKTVADAAAIFVDDSKLMEISQDRLNEAGEATSKAETTASFALAEARKFISAQQVDRKGKDTSEEATTAFAAFQERLDAVEIGIAKYKTLSTNVDERLTSWKQTEALLAHVKVMDDRITEAAELVGKLGVLNLAAEVDVARKDECDKATKAAEVAMTEAEGGLKGLQETLQSQLREQAISETAAEKLEPRVKELDEKLQGAQGLMRARSEKVVVQGMFTEAETHLKEAEEAVKRAVEAEAPFLRSEEDLSMEATSTALADLDAVAKASNEVVSNTRTFLETQKTTAEGFTPSVAEPTAAELEKFQARLDQVAAGLETTKKSISSRKDDMLKREVLSSVEEAEKKVLAATHATAQLTARAFAEWTENARDQAGEEVAPELMRGVCEIAGKAQHEAQDGLNDARTLLMNRQRDVKSGNPESPVLGELKQLLDKFSPLQTELDRQKGVLRDQEHKFIAQRLLQDAIKKVVSLEQKLALTVELADPLLSQQRKEEYSVMIFLAHVVDALRGLMAREGKSSKMVFDDMKSKRGKISEERFVSFVQPLPDITDEKGIVFSEEVLVKSFKHVAGSDSDIGEDRFLELFQSRYLCTSKVSMTDVLVVKGGKTIRRLEPNEVVEALEEPARDEGAGLTRVKARSEKDNTVGYVTLSGNQGTVYIERYSPYIGRYKAIEAGLQELSDEANHVSKYIDQKNDELQSVRSGPLADTREKLEAMRPRVSQVQGSYASMRAHVSESKRQLDGCVDEERRKQQELADTDAAAKMTVEVGNTAASLQARIDKVIPAADAVIQSRASNVEGLAAAFQNAVSGIEDVQMTVDQAKEKLKTDLNSIKKSSKGPLADVRTVLVKLRVKLDNFEAKCKKQLDALRAAHAEIATAAHEMVVGALRAHMQKTGSARDALFKQLSGDAQEVPLKRFTDFLKTLDELNVHGDHLEMGLQRYAAGISKVCFLQMLQDYWKCVREIAMTNTSEVKDSKTLRKIDPDEVVEVLEAGRVNETIGVARVRCRALLDSLEGWVTLRGNQGTVFLECVPKPYSACQEETSITESFDRFSLEVGVMKPGEVVETIQGPKQEGSQEMQRIRGKASKDSKVGWATLKDVGMSASFELARLLVCRSSVAMTTSFDISQGKAIRMLDVGEALEVMEGPTEDEGKQLRRVKARAKRDAKEGWVTMQGNAGTVYIEQSDRHYLCKRGTMLESEMSSGSAVVRKLEEGESFELLEGPQTLEKPGETRVKVRYPREGKEGWLTLSSSNMRPWQPRYKCTAQTVLHEALELTSKVVRTVQPGEFLEALDTPIDASGVLRVRVRTEKDGVVGFLTVRESQGPVLLESIAS